MIDDVQFLMGLALILVDDAEEGVSSIMQTQRFYPSLEYGRYVREISGTLVEALEQSDWVRLRDLAQQWLDVYFESHQWPIIP